MKLAVAIVLVLIFSSAYTQTVSTTITNPVLEGWYADPEGVVFNNQFWIFPTFSAPFDEQVFMDAFSSTDLVHWKKHARILDTAHVSWAKRAMWAPSVVAKDGRYFLFFGANDVHEGEVGGIGVAVSDKPEGPFVDHLGKPLISEIKNGAQPIDQFVFRNDDGQYYMIYGGWRHCNIVRLNPDFTGLLPFPDGSMFKEITPDGYVEGPFVFTRNNKYYFMWSEGDWGGPDYRVAYAISNSLMGPFERIGTILEQDPAIATGAGHHSIVKDPKSGQFFIVYHRRPLGETDPNHRVVCIDKLQFDSMGKILPVKMSSEKKK
jgi:beta-xylosidase